MKVGDSVKHKSKANLGVGKIISFQQHLGTVLVKFEGSERLTYHSPMMLMSVPK